MSHLERLPSDAVATHWSAFAFGLYQTGFMLSMSLVTVPVMQQTSIDAANLLNQFKSFHTHGHFYGPAATMCISLLHAYTAFRKGRAGRPWLLSAVAAAASISVWPFTILFMDPINNLLYDWRDTAAEVPLVRVQERFAQWEWLHTTRSIFLLVGALSGFLALRQEQRLSDDRMRHLSKSKQ